MNTETLWPSIKGFSIILALLIVVGGLGAFLITGCKSSPTRIAYNVEAGTELTVDQAMELWGSYVAQFHPPAAQEAIVKELYDKYQISALALVDVTSAASGLTSTNSADVLAAKATVAQCLADLLAALRSFGVKL